MTREELIRIFKESGNQFVSGEQLSKRLGCTRAAVWKHIEELRQEGYCFEAVRKTGYRLISSPNLLTPEEISYGLKTKRIGQHIEYRQKVDSTQSVARELADGGAPEGFIVVADQQESGRGRLGRNWYSPSGAGIWMSMILRPNLELAMSPQITLLSAVAIIRAIRKVVDVDAMIKWPNDILINNKKVCGILSEMNAEWDRVSYIIVGIGVNVNTQKDDFPEELQEKATSLALEFGHPISRAELVREICMRFEELYDLYLEHGFAPIKHLWESYAAFIGKKITVHAMDETSEGIFLGIDENGVLLLQTSDGIIKKIYSADLPVI